MERQVKGHKQVIERLEIISETDDIKTQRLAIWLGQVWPRHIQGSAPFKLSNR